MTRIAETFQTLKAAGRKALIPYISAGDPNPADTVAVMHALVAGGADLLELGIPFSDPAADGETIQQANERALARGVTLDNVLAMAKDFRADNHKTPLILMGYLNSFERRGISRVFQEIQHAGIDGVILVDCPIEALPDYQNELEKAGIDPILLLAPTTLEPRKSRIISAAKGFIYYVSLRGVTGKQSASADNIRADVQAVKAQTDTPVCIGFGIKEGETARAMTAFADGAVVGSALVAALHETAQQGGDTAAAAQAFVSTIRAALDE